MGFLISVSYDLSTVLEILEDLTEFICVETYLFIIGYIHICQCWGCVFCYYNKIAEAGNYIKKRGYLAHSFQELADCTEWHQF